MVQKDSEYALTNWMWNSVDAWTRASDHFVASFVEANHGALALFGLPERNGARRSAYPSVSYDREDWTATRSVESPAHISVGDSVQFTKRLSDADVRAFAAASGDTNCLHLEDEFAADTRFGERIAHGTLVGGLISAALARLPGLTIYLSQDLRFLGPVSIGTELTADVEVIEDLGDNRYRLSTTVTDERKQTIIDGEAVVLIDDPPSSKSK
ncbi:MAG: MaoC family dehydratase [Halobacteriota archaeon]